MEDIQENFRRSPVLRNNVQHQTLSSSKSHLSTDSLLSRNSRSGLVAVPENFTSIEGLSDRLGNLRFKKAGKENEGQFNCSEIKDNLSLKNKNESPEKNSLKKETKQIEVQKQENSDPDSKHEPEIRTWSTHKGLTLTEIEKISKPKVKRLVNVCQICKKNLLFFALIFFSFS